MSEIAGLTFSRNAVYHESGLLDQINRQIEGSQIIHLATKMRLARYQDTKTVNQSEPPGSSGDQPEDNQGETANPSLVSAKSRPYSAAAKEK
jgi:hypothetical protein